MCDENYFGMRFMWSLFFLGYYENFRNYANNYYHIQAPINQTTVNCDDWFEELNSIAETIETDHGQSANKHCVYCKTVLLSFKKDKNHILCLLDCRYGQWLIFFFDKQQWTWPAATTDKRIKLETNSDSSQRKIEKTSDQCRFNDALEGSHRWSNIWTHSTSISQSKILGWSEVDEKRHCWTKENRNWENPVVYKPWISASWLQWLEKRKKNIKMIEHMLNAVNCFASHRSEWLVENFWTHHHLC